MNWSSPRIVESLEEPEGTDEGRRSRSPRQMSKMVGRLSPRIPRFSPNNSGPVSRPNFKDSAMQVQERDKTHKGANDSIAHMPQLDLRSLSKDHQLEAPLTVDRLMGFLRCRSTPRNESEVFKEFEEDVKELIERNAKHPPIFRISAFYDESIIPAGSSNATPRSARPVSGESALELLYMFYAGRQQPGAGGLTKDVAFQDISSFNASMSFSETIKFVNEKSSGTIFSIFRLGLALTCSLQVCEHALPDALYQK